MNDASRRLNSLRITSTLRGVLLRASYSTRRANFDHSKCLFLRCFLSLIGRKRELDCCVVQHWPATTAGGSALVCQKDDFLAVLLVPVAAGTMCCTLQRLVRMMKQ